MRIGIGTSIVGQQFGGVDLDDVWNFCVEVFDASTETWDTAF